MEYFLKFSAILGLFFIFYKLFLEKETFFNSIRIYFMVGIVSALTLPFIIIPEYVTVEGIFVEQTISSAPEMDNSNQLSNFSLSSILILVYGLGVMFLSIRFLIQLGSRRSASVYSFRTSAIRSLINS